MKNSIPFLVLIFIVNNCYPQNKADEKADVLVHQLHRFYDYDSGLWKNTSWWNNANVLTTLIKYGQETKNDSIKTIVQNTFLKTKKFKVPATKNKQEWICTNYINDFYDDEGWWALAWIDAYEWTENPEYLKMAKIIFKDITSGWDHLCNGGIYWKKNINGSGKATISNELAMLIATRLHVIDPQVTNGKSCLQWAISIWNWMLQSKLVKKNGLIMGGIRYKSNVCHINPKVRTYTQGVILSGLVNLYKITSEKSYINYAHNIANSTINHMTDSNSILIEKSCEPKNCNGDAEQFKGVFIRHLDFLNQFDHKKTYSNFINNNAKSIWKYSMKNGEKSPNVSWNSYSKKNSPATISSALDAFNALINLQKKIKIY